jgi:hypothetical protein
MDDWYRLFVEFDPDSEDLKDPSAAQLGINIYYKNRLLAHIQSPNVIGGVWDIGALKPSSGEFIETNVLVPAPFQDPLEHLGEF